MASSMRPSTAALAAAAPELGLTLSPDPDQARQKGKAFEEQAIRQLQGR